MDLSKARCPECGHAWQYRNPLPTVDMIIEVGTEESPRIVLIKRKNPPHGWALPGGFVDWGETVEEAAVRESKEETGLEVELVRQFHVYSKPDRDPRGHMMSTVFVARAEGEPREGDDAAEAAAFAPEEMPKDIVFDHPRIIKDYLTGKY